MATQTIQPVKGTRDFYPELMAFRTWLYEKVREVSRRFGYEEYEAPMLERLELYAAKSGEELVKEQSYVFADRGGDEITLRPELTPSLARMIAQRQAMLVLPVRWFSFGPFWRYERPQRGRSREFFQWNIDLLGAETAAADGEIVSISAEFFRSIGLSSDEVAIHVNSRRLMEQKLGEIGVDLTRRVEYLQLIDRRDRMPAEKWREWALDLGLTQTQLDALGALFDNRELWRESEELCQVFATAEAFGVRDYLVYDAGIVRGLDYYTGIVFEGHDRENFFRALFGGGRYDNLVGDVGGDRLAGVGFAMGDVIVELLLAQLGKLPELPSTPSDVLVTLFGEELYGVTVALASRLRAAGINTEQVLEADRLGRQFRYADRKDIPYVVILGPDELAAGQVMLKDMVSGEQQAYTEEALIARLLAARSRS